ncbi:hypothetical protein TSAR_007989 [Trichomalopsis sarcophagae]|uniref:Uncharacterized protein n=1 Tax=Trichomalopsis sarcophagae TaxID=543379 RepID=A0A232FNI1_9HYME|nr:hypothetical protein TSAR_007989 [Trichomalopsis sarcophagae]
MSSELTTKLPYTGQISELNSVNGSNRVKTSVASARSMQGPSSPETQTPNPAMQGDNLAVLKDKMRKTIEYAESRTNVHGPIKKGSQESLASIVSARSIDSNLSTKQIAEYKVSQQTAIKAQEDSYQDAVDNYQVWHEIRGARGRLLKDTVLASAGSKRPRQSPTNSPKKKSVKKHARKRERHERAAMQRETFTPRVPHNASKQLTKARSNKNKRPEGILVKVGQNGMYAEVMGTIRRDVNPNTFGTRVLGVKQTKSGDVSLKLGRGSDSVYCESRKSSAGFWTGQKGRTKGHSRNKGHGPGSYERRVESSYKRSPGKARQW